MSTLCLPKIAESMRFRMFFTKMNGKLCDSRRHRPTVTPGHNFEKYKNLYANFYISQKYETKFSKENFDQKFNEFLKRHSNKN